MSKISRASGRVVRRAVLVVSVLVAVAAVAPAGASSSASWTSVASGEQLDRRVLTVGEGTGSYMVGQSGGVLTAAAGGQWGNQREVFWPAGQSLMTDSRVCVTWTSEPDTSAQEGVALRITGTRAITVTKNVIWGIYWVFNIHVWDGPAFTQIGQVDLSSVVIGPDGQRRPFPWRICAETIDQALLFKVWVPGVEAEPVWGDSTHGGIVAVPAAYTVPGKTGWYAGHLPAGTSVTYADLGVWGYGG
jgi:hypothetical protein